MSAVEPPDPTPAASSRRRTVRLLVGTMMLAALSGPIGMLWFLLTAVFPREETVRWTGPEVVGLGVMAVGVWLPVLLGLIVIAVLGPGGPARGHPVLVTIDPAAPTATDPGSEDAGAQRFDRWVTAGFFVGWALLAFSATIVTDLLSRASCGATDCPPAPGVGAVTVLLAVLIPWMFLIVVSVLATRWWRPRRWPLPLIGLGVSLMSMLLGWLLTMR